jgi:signal transduction histidine kinase
MGIKPTAPYWIGGFLLLFCLNILRGGNSLEHTDMMPVRDSLEKTIAGKSVWDILSVANKYSLTNLKTALAYAEIAIEKAQKTNNAEDIFNAYRGMGFIYEDNRDLEKAIQAYEFAAQISQTLPDSFKTTIFNDLAVLNRKTSHFRVSYDYYDRVLDIAQRIGDREMVASAYHGQAQMHTDIGNYDNAIALFLKSLSVSQEMNSRLNIIVSHIDIAETYRKTKEWEKALTHIQKAHDMADEQLRQIPEDLEANIQYASTLKTYGAILTDQNKFGQALEKYKKALAHYQKINHRASIARTLKAIANVHVKEQNFAEAEAKFKECLVYEDQFLDRDQADMHFSRAMLYKQQKRNAEAEKAFLTALTVSQQHDLKDLASKSHYQLFLIYLEQHKNDLALTHLNRYNTLNDSLFNEEKLRRTAEYEFKYDTERREREFASLKASQDRFLLIFLIAASLSIVLALAYIIQMRGRSMRQLKMKSEEIQAQYRRLEESNEILSQFAYVVAHDLKEPLRSIGSYIGLIQMKHGKDLPQDAREYMQFVNAGVKRMYSLLTDLLDFSQVISQQPGAEVVRPEDVLEDVKANLRNAIESKNALVECSHNLPSIRMNRMHMLQLFQNLIGNALKFTREKPLVRVEGKEENGNVVLTIEDNGIGIKPEFSSKVFVLFQQLNKKGTFDGTGIGLTICKNIVDKYNGKIWFESEENKGTKFFISFPANAA